MCRREKGWAEGVEVEEEEKGGRVGGFLKVG